MLLKGIEMKYNVINIFNTIVFTFLIFKPINTLALT